MLPHIAVILRDSQRRIQWVNYDFTIITGYQMEEVIGQTPGKLLQGPDTEQDAIERIRLALRKRYPLKDVLTNYRKNGDPYPCKLVIYPIFDFAGTLQNFIAFEVDGNEVPDESDIPMLQLKDKYGSSSLKGTNEIKLFNNLNVLLSKEKVYLNSELSLKQVADRLQTNTKYLSQVVNKHFGSNFQTYLNTFRVEEAKKKVLDPALSHLTLYGIALQCGFKNKSTFYKVFKDITGLTPRAFIKGAMISSNGIS